MRVLLAIAIVVGCIILVVGCTSSHIYVSTGDGARAGKRSQLESSTDIDAELNTSIVGVGKNKLIKPK